MQRGKFRVVRKKIAEKKLRGRRGTRGGASFFGKGQSGPNDTPFRRVKVTMIGWPYAVMAIVGDVRDERALQGNSIRTGPPMTLHRALCRAKPLYGADITEPSGFLIEAYHNIVLVASSAGLSTWASEKKNKKKKTLGPFLGEHPVTTTGAIRPCSSSPCNEGGGASQGLILLLPPLAIARGARLQPSLQRHCLL